jgi:hypothetical protein
LHGKDLRNSIRSFTAITTAGAPRSGRHDIGFMAIGCIFSLITFVYLVGLQVFDYDLAAGTQVNVFGICSINLIKTLFVTYTAIIALAFLSVSISSRLKLFILKKVCDRLFELGARQRPNVASEALREAMEFGAKLDQGLPAAPVANPEPPSRGHQNRPSLSPNLKSLRISLRHLFDSAIASLTSD